MVCGCKSQLIRELYGTGDGSVILLCVGNIGKRKNQGQLITAFSLLPVDLAEKTYILFCGGKQDSGYTIEALSHDSKWKNHFITCGVVPKDRIDAYYEQSDAVALMSLSEGFGLSLIEGMHFGKPSISFTDVDAFEDIYSPDAMVGVEEHSDEAVAKGLERLLTGKWDSSKIKQYSEKFESQAMANNYIDVYQSNI